MKAMNFVLITAALALVLAAPAAAGEPSRPLASLFPQLPGWQMEEKAELFLPETLYEHIDGAAENFLNYDFEQLAVQNYSREQKSLSAEIYFHGKPENAFGIYSSEKPLAGNYFTIGSQAYAEEGVLNFICDAYYVKLVGFGLGPQDKDILFSLARQIAATIGGGNALPKTLEAFPTAGKQANSERFILNNFLGHDFLHTAYAADYQVNGQNFQLFVIDAGSEGQARAMLEKYASLDKTSSAPSVQPRKGTDADVQPGARLINDPYNGPLQIFWRGKFICGSNGQSPAVRAVLEEMAGKLSH